jgi:hypothetical protein
MKIYELFESFFLAENKDKYLLDNFGSKLLDANKKDNTKVDTAEEILTYLNKADPTGSKNMVFLTKMYAAGQFRLEDVSRINSELKLFQQVKSKLENKDISSYKSLNDLYDALEPFQSAPEEDMLSGKQIAKKIKSDAETLISTPNFKVIIPKTEEAACFYGKGTKWCTAGDSDNQFNHYNNDGPLYVIIAKDPKTGKDRKFQLHYESEQFMNERDQALTAADISFLSSFEEYTQFLNLLVKKHSVPHIPANLR